MEANGSSAPPRFGPGHAGERCERHGGPGQPGKGGCSLNFPTPSGGPTRYDNRVPAAGLGRKRVLALMGNKLRQSDSGSFDQAMDETVRFDGSASLQDRTPSVRARAGRTLRHWTTDGLAFVGKATTTAFEPGDWGLADGRQRNLVASRLKSLIREVGAP